MKIVLVNYRYFMTSGAEAFMFKFKTLLEKHGHTVIPFSTKNQRNRPSDYASYFAKGRSEEGEVLYNKIKKTPGNILKMLAGAFYNPDAEKSLRRLLRDERPDVVFVLQEMNALSPSVFSAAKKEGIPTVYRQSDFHLFCPRYDCLKDGQPCTDCLTRHSFSPAVKSRCVKGSLPATLVRCASMRFHRLFRLFDSIDAFVVPARFTLDLLIKAGFPEEKLMLLPTFIDCGDKPRVTGDGRTMIFSGRLSPEKGIETLLTAVSKMRHREVVVKLLGKGEADYVSELKALTARLGIEDRVIFTGFLDSEALTAEVEKAALVVHPAIWYENMPNAVLEAFAFGKPVIASNIGSLPEMVEDGVNGLLFEPGDADELAEKADHCFDHPEMRMTMGENARAICETRYSPEGYYEKIQQLFDRITAKGQEEKEP